MSLWLKSLLSLAALIVIVIGGFVLVMLGQDMWRTATQNLQTTEMVNVDPANETLTEQLFLSDITRIGDGPLTRATLLLTQEFGMGGGFASYSKSSSDNALNMVFLEPGAAERWLFETNDQLIYSSHSLTLTPLGSILDRQPEAALLLQIISEDSDGDKRLTDQDRVALAVVQPDGRGLTTLIEDLQGSVRIVPDASAFVMLIDTTTGVNQMRVDPTSFAILDQKAIDFPK